ncbi:MAG TPA: S8 family serine peptidase [Pseudomonadales bacterium]
MKQWLLLALLLLALPLQAGGRLIVQFNQLAAQDQLVIDGLQLQSRQQQLPGVAVYRFAKLLDRQAQLQHIAALRRQPAVNWVAEDESGIRLQWQGDADPALLQQQAIWHQPHRLPGAWDTNDSCAGVVVAVLDSGVDATHTDLAGNVFVNLAEQPGSSIDNDGNGYNGDYQGWNAIANNGDSHDGFGHGSHIAGIIAAAGQSLGVCRTVEVLPVRFLDSWGNGSIADAVKAIYYVLALQQQYPDRRFIINNSWAAVAYNSALANAIADATAAGILLVNAAGNSGQDVDQQAAWPAVSAADNPASITVANADTREPAPYALHGRSAYGFYSVTLAAAGSGIVSTWPGQAHRSESGSSMAAAVVSGIAALVWSQQPQMSAAEVRAVLETAVDTYLPMQYRLKNPGLLNAVQAQQQAGQPQPVAVSLQQQAQAVLLQGAWFDRLVRLLQDGDELAITAVSSTQLQIARPDRLRCGWLELQDAQARSSRLYIDWQPRPPQLLSLQRLEQGGVLTFQADAAIDEIVVQLAGSTGEFHDLARRDAGQQTVLLDYLADDSRIRLQGISWCRDRSGDLIEKASSYSAELVLADLTAPVWRTVAISEAVAGKNYYVQLVAEPADSFRLQPFAGDECLPDGLQFADNGVLSGQPLHAGTCTFRVAAIAADSQLHSLQTLQIDVKPADDGHYRLRNGQGNVLASVESEQPLHGLALQQSAEQWRLNGWQPASQPDYSLTLAMPSLYALAALRWRTAEGASLPVSGNHNGHYATVLVDSASYYALPEIDRPARFELEFTGLQQRLLPLRMASPDSRCFIASAVYGDRHAADVVALRHLRDQALARWPAQVQPWVDSYYHHSPQWVAWMERHPPAAQLARQLLRPLLHWLAGLAQDADDR